MTERLLQTEVLLDAPLDQVFDFFSKAENLGKITPPWVEFNIHTPLPIQMAEGTLIDYSIKVRHIKMNWRTKITVWEPGVRFVDEQLRGPYKQWIHEHRFESVGHKTKMTDTVRYIVPGGWIEPLIYPFIRRDVERIFQYRQKVMNGLIKNHQNAERVQDTGLQELAPTPEISA